MVWTAICAQREAFGRFLASVVVELGQIERRVAATRYVQGLLRPGQRKSVEPMAQRLGVDAQGLQQFVSDNPWNEQAIWTVVRQDIIPHLEPMKTWVIGSALGGRFPSILRLGGQAGQVPGERGTGGE